MRTIDGNTIESLPNDFWAAIGGILLGVPLLSLVVGGYVEAVASAPQVPGLLYDWIAKWHSQMGLFGMTLGMGVGFSAAALYLIVLLTPPVVLLRGGYHIIAEEVQYQRDLDRWEREIRAHKMEQLDAYLKEEGAL